MSIPFCFSSDSGEQQCQILTRKKEIVDIAGSACPSWVMPNAQGSGYYRWNLPTAQWQALTERFAEFAPTEQLSIIDSAFAAFEAGKLSANQLLEVVRQSARAGKRQVITMPLRNLRKYRNHYLGKTQHSTFLNFAQNLYLPLLDSSANSSDPDQQMLHNDLLGFMALVAKDPDARKQLMDKAIAFTGFNSERDPQALDSDLYGPALTVAVQDAGEDFLAHLVKVRGELDDPRFENASANAIGSSNSPEQITTIQKLALSEEMGPREAFGLIQYSLAQPMVQERNWKWLQQNFDKVVEKIPSQIRRRTPAFASIFCDAKHLEELQQLFVQHGDLTPGYQRSLAQTEERIQLCMALEEKGQSLMQALPKSAGLAGNN